MNQTEVLITFYSRRGSTERLALATAVGAVQARANIRLRRLPDSGIATTVEESRECKETLARMRKEYVAPTEVDVLRADALVFVAPFGFNTSSGEWTEYFSLLTRLQSEGKLHGKVGAAIAASGTALAVLSATILQLGLIAIPPASEDPAIQGRRVAAEARAVKESRLI